MTDPDVMRLRPYWQYDAVNDSHTRPSHLAMDAGFPGGFPGLGYMVSPNGFRCRCTVGNCGKEDITRQHVWQGLWAEAWNCR